MGFFIFLIAWLLVDTILKVFLRGNQDATGAAQIEGYGPWNDIKCSESPDATPLTPPQGGGLSVVTGQCSGGCVALDLGVRIKNGACSGSSCMVSSLLAPKINALNTVLTSANIAWQVTEAYPPTRQHRDPCHAQGTCIDANCIGGCSASQVKQFIDSARAQGLRPVYEVKTQAEKDALTAAGVSGANIQVLGNWISGAHFSVYNN
jgi:hypothetical protein